MPILLLISGLRSNSRLFFTGLVGAILASCSSRPAYEEKSPTVPSASTDSVTIQYAQGFTVDYRRSAPTLLLHGSSDTASYVLLPRGASPPPDLSATTPVIRTPVQRVVVTSTTHLGLVELLDARDCLVGVGQADMIYDEAIRRRVQRGEIQEVGTDGALNVEWVLSLQPDLVMVSSTPGVGTSQYQPLIDAGIPVIVNAEWQEASPLGKAEWVKLMAVLLQREADANQRFAAVVTAYDSVAQRVQSVRDQPRVLTGSPFQGSWYVPGRNSYVGQLLRDAQATWPWAQDTTAVSFNVALETVYPHGLEADYWINAGLAQQLSALDQADERLRSFRPYQQKQVYNHYRRTTAAGGNDYYEGGTVRPDRVLADLIEIFHPEVLDHTLYYYQRLD